MDPILMIRLGNIRQEEYIEQAEALRYAQPIWERIYRWAAPRIAARRANVRTASAEAPDTCVTTVPSIADNC